MYTAYIKEITGVKVVLGVDTLKIDPVGSAKCNKLTYFSKTNNEKDITEEEYLQIKNKLNKLKPKEFLRHDKVVIKDNREVSYISDNKIVKIENIGEEPKGKLLTECSFEELEDLRFKNLTKKERLSEYESTKKIILSNSINKKNEAEILRQDNPIKIGQDFYDSEISKAKTKYGVK